MIYKTTRFKKVKKYGRNQSKRNMRGGRFNESGKWTVGIPLLAVVGVVVFVILVALGIILRGGGGRKTQ